MNMASDFSLLHGTSFLTSFSFTLLRHSIMGGGNHHPFSLFVFERREEEDPEVCALVPFLFPFLVFVVVDAERYDVYCASKCLSLSLLLPRGKRIELEIDSRAFILSNNTIEYCNILHTKTAPPTHVTTVDETLESTVFARSLCHRAYVLGFFFLPCVWGAAAYYFSPPPKKKGPSIRRDAVVDRYVHKMRRGSIAWLCAAGTWTVAWYLVGPETTVLHVPGWFWVE